jgi:hypothetical protein
MRARTDYPDPYFWKENLLKYMTISCCELKIWNLKLIEIIFKNPVSTSQKAQHVSTTKTTLFVLVEEMISLYSDNRTKEKKYFPTRI